jgi:hypothetical protein
MGRLDRLKEYSNPRRGPQGVGRDQKNLDYWADRAKQNSKLAPRATGIDETVMPHSTGKSMGMRDTASAPRAARSADKRMAAKDDQNFVGDSSYMAGVRRNA